MASYAIRGMDSYNSPRRERADKTGRQTHYRKNHKPPRFCIMQKSLANLGKFSPLHGLPPEYGIPHSMFAMARGHFEYHEKFPPLHHARH